MPASAPSSRARMVSATTRPDSRMIAISREDLRTMVLSAVGFKCIRVAAPWAALCIAECGHVAFVLGLTGNIACGKSTVGTLLTDRFGADYVDADRIVHGLYASGTRETAAIAKRFGQDLLQTDGTIDRRR